jgi:hypothetical protein
VRLSISRIVECDDKKELENLQIMMILTSLASTKLAKPPPSAHIFSTTSSIGALIRQLVPPNISSA